MSKRNRNKGSNATNSSVKKMSHPLDAPDEAAETAILPVVPAGSATSSQSKPAHSASVVEANAGEVSKEALVKSLQDANDLIDKLKVEKGEIEKDLKSTEAKLIEQVVKNDDLTEGAKKSGEAQKRAEEKARKSVEAQNRAEEEAKVAREKAVKAEENIKLIELNLANKVEELEGAKSQVQEVQVRLADISDRLKTAESTIACKNEEVRKLKLRLGELEKQRRELSQKKEAAEAKAKETPEYQLNRFQEASLLDADAVFSRVLRDFSEEQEEKVLKALRQLFDASRNLSEERMAELLKAALAMRDINVQAKKDARKAKKRQKRFAMFG